MTPSVADVSALPIGPEIDAGPARRPDRGTVLTGRHVRLTPIDPALHLGALHAAANGTEAERLWLYLGAGPFPERDAFRIYLENLAVSEDPFAYAILDAHSGEALGHATFMRIEPAHRVIEVGNILFTPALQRKPGATEAMYLMARHAFEDLGYRRYEWKCNAFNAPSLRAATRYGFSYEGLFRHHMIVKGRSRDTAWFSMLAGEWPSRKAAFERWLDPGNFDADGLQRLALAALNDRVIPGHPDPRRAEAGDAAILDGLQGRAYAPNRAILGVEPLPLMVASSDVLARYEVWLATAGESAAAALVLDPYPDHLLIWSLAVDPDRQRQGWGTRLLQAADARAQALGLGEVRLYTGAKLTRNVAFYQRNGFAITSVETVGDRERVNMARQVGRGDGWQVG